MSRKDYVLLADAIRAAHKRAEVNSLHPEETKRTLAYVKSEMVRALGFANSRFDADIFLKHCQPD